MSYPPGPPHGGATPEGYPYPPPQFGQYPPGAVPPTNGKATAALITGVSSLVLSWCCGMGLAGIVAIVLGVKARREIRAGGGVQVGDGMALAGIVTGALAVVTALAFIVFVIVVLATGNVDFDSGGYTTRT